MARVYPRSGVHPSNQVVEEACVVVVEAQPEVYGAAAIVAAGVADAVSVVVGRSIVHKLEEGSWRYVEDRQRASWLVGDPLGMNLEEVLDRPLDQWEARRKGVAEADLAAAVCLPEVAEVAHSHIWTSGCLMPVLGTAFQSHIGLLAVRRWAEEEVTEGRHLREETVVGVA